MLSKPRRLRLGAILPAALVVILAGSVVAAGAASASRAVPPHQPGGGVQEVVTSVNGSDASLGACVGSDTGTFTMVGHIRQGIVTVNLAATTTYTDAALTPPTSATYANVCVGDQVKVLGTLSSGALAATAVTIVPAQAQGTVTSVTVGNGNASTAPGSCGTGGSPGSFTLAVRHHDIVTVDVNSTTFSDAALTPATFADVCVGSQVDVLGTLSSGALAASAVTIVPAEAQGTVTSVNGVATPSTCGTTLPGYFTLAARHHDVVTVGVTTGTTFTDAALTSATFTEVCVGSQVTALGTLSSTALAATLVTIVPAQAQGTVTSVTVDGGTPSTTPGSCGTALSAGSFTLGGFWALPVTAAAPRFVTAVDVTSGTTFSDAALKTPTSATFGYVCVGSQVTALGTLSSGALAATLVTIVPAQAQGTVTSVTVDGGTASTTTGSCGTNGSTGSFTVGGFRALPMATAALRRLTTVGVTATTAFTDAALATPMSASFLNVCVGDQVTALGTLSTGDELAATLVTIVPGQVEGIVTSVTAGGAPVTTVGSCGTADVAGSFTVAGIAPIGIVPLPVAAISARLLTTVDVTTGTTFTDAALATPASASFVNVCVGGHVEAVGTLSSGVLAATAVTILPPIALVTGHGNRRG
ncbi:MAG: hypothetical protein ABSF89_08430 [Acidimicrobiales bacterium]|jgi:hypothetical protein